MPPASRGSISTATPISRKTAENSNAPRGAATRIKPKRTNSPGAGGCDFAPDENVAVWTPHALPSVVILTQLPGELADPKFSLSPGAIAAVAGAEGPDRIITHRGVTARVHFHEAGTGPQAVLLPLDQLFDIRANAAIRFWRGLLDRNPGPNPAALSTARRNRLILGLRALDARTENATYRDIAGALFGGAAIPGRDWKSHDLRQRTLRLVQFGTSMMRTGYKSLLLHPYRRRR
jgi:hypothetical protein